MVSWLFLPGCFCLVHRTWRCSRRASPPTTPSSSWRRMVTTRRSWWELEAWDGFILVLPTLYFGASMWLVYPHLLQQLHFDWLYMCGCWWYVSVMRIQNARPLLSRSLVANNDTAITVSGSIEETENSTEKTERYCWYLYHRKKSCYPHATLMASWINEYIQFGARYPSYVRPVQVW